MVVLLLLQCGFRNWIGHRWTALVRSTRCCNSQRNLWFMHWQVPSLHLFWVNVKSSVVPKVEETSPREEFAAKGELSFAVDDHTKACDFRWYVDRSSSQGNGQSVDLDELLSAAQPYKLHLVGIQFQVILRHPRSYFFYACRHTGCRCTARCHFPDLHFQGQFCHFCWFANIS